MSRGVPGGIWGIPLDVDLRDFWGESIPNKKLKSWRQFYFGKMLKLNDDLLIDDYTGKKNWGIIF